MARMPGPLHLIDPSDRSFERSRHPRAVDPVDTPLEASVSFAPPDNRPRPAPRHTVERLPIAVGPGRPPAVVPPRSGPLRDEVVGYPIQLAKVHPPVLRDETLERPRLLDWLRLKVHGRVVLVLADAGYGKSTLLADFSRRTRLRTLWYRFDEDDRDWVCLLHHLVAAGREHVADFAPETSALLARTGIGGPGREEVLDVFLRELPTIADNGAALIFDDFHVVDDAADVRHITRRLLEAAPERLSIVFASRRQPAVPLARLRAMGEVAELRTDALRFDVAETTQLFNETYGRHIEPDVLVDLARRTEGWVASLHLVQAALRDRSPAEIRRFVRGLTGADHELYDYLAEEVVGDLPEELQRYLMETSILQVVTPDLAEIATSLDPSSVARLTVTAERLTLLSRASGTPRTHRYHPLVREFLEARLRSMDGDASVRDRHRQVAVAAATSDWRVAAYHYREAGDIDAMLEVVGDAIPTIMGNGQYALAESFIGSVAPDERPAKFDLILSRVDMQQGDYANAIAASLAVLAASDTDPVERDHALLNLVTLYLNYGDGDRAIAYAERLKDSDDPNLAAIAEASVAMVTGSEDDDIDRINRMLTSMAKMQRSNRTHHYAVTQYNLASNYVVQDQADHAIAILDPALAILEQGSAAIELAAARLLRATALAMVGRNEDAWAAIEVIRQTSTEYQEDEVAIGIADLLDSYLDPHAATDLFSAIDTTRSLTPSGLRLATLSRARMLARRRRHADALVELDRYPPGRPAHLGIGSALALTRAYVAVSEGTESGRRLAADALQVARHQGAHRWRRCAEVLLALTGDGSSLGRQLVATGKESSQSLTYLSDVIVPRLHEVDDGAIQAVATAAATHPVRWRTHLRETIDSGAPSMLMAGRVLEEIGETEDIARLRRVGKQQKRHLPGSQLGRTLARRLADGLYVEDQGRLWLRVGDRTVHGTEVRRKVLALVCFLLTRPRLSCTRDQMLEALWPDLSPSVAINSLNQTIYFLRRIIEEDYDEDLSPGYVHHDSDVLWLDPDLVTSRSIECRDLIRELPNEPSPDDVERLVALYEGRFALDFEYEEWAASYRDTLHASYLEIVERSVLHDISVGHHDRAIRVARRALEIDSTAENIEVSLLRLYRLTGAHAAAAEQYAHYASVLREELGIEPPPLESL